MRVPLSHRPFADAARGPSINGKQPSRRRALRAPHAQVFAPFASALAQGLGKALPFKADAIAKS
jgi:hypothetical protein